MATLVECLIDPGGTGDFEDVDTAAVAHFGASGHDLTVTDEYVVVTIISTNGDPFTQYATIDLTTDATRNITIIVDPDYRTDGKYAATGNIARFQIANSACLLVYSDYTKIYGLAIEHSSNTGYTTGLYVDATGCEVDGLVIDSVTTTGAVQTYGINFQARSGYTLKISNAQITASGTVTESYGYYANTATGGTVWLYNCSIRVRGAAVYIRSGTDCILKNCILDGETLGDINGADPHADSDVNALMNYTADPAAGTNWLDWSGVEDADIYVDVDTSLARVDPELTTFKLGANLTEDTDYPVTKDLLLVDRPDSAPWTLGCYHVAEAVAPPATTTLWDADPTTTPNVDFERRPPPEWFRKYQRGLHNFPFPSKQWSI